MNIELYAIIFVMIVFFARLSFINWRWGVKGCLFYLPFAGVVSLYFYPAKLPLLFKDLFFVLPAYLGFLLVRKKTFFPKTIVTLLALFFGLVIIQLFNPNLLNLFMGFIGLKVWLFYIPLFFLAYHLVDSKEQLLSLTKKIVIIGLVPCVIGIIEAVLIYAGLERYVYAVYGETAAPATQQFARLNIGSGFLARIPSTFTYVAQYFNFTLCMVPLAYAVSQDPESKRFGMFALLTIITASFLSGCRAAFIFVPLLLILIYGFHKGLQVIFRSSFVLLPILLVVVVAVYLFGGILPLWHHMSNLLVHYWNEIVVGVFVSAVTKAPFGLGTGMNTGPARHAFANSEKLAPMMENYYAKAVYELGIIGLLLLLLIFFALIYKGYKIHKKIQDDRLSAFSSGLLAYLILMIIQSVKGWHLDLDPVNVYFWFFAGILMKLKVIDKNESSQI